MNTTGTNLDDVRRHNLSMVLGLVHHRGAVSRAQITRETGLNRSTVAGLVGELVERGFVVESPPEGKKAVGRPSPVVTPHPAFVAFAVNPELDAVTVAMVGLTGRVLETIRHEVEVPPTVDETVSIAAGHIDTFRAALPVGAVIAGIGVAVPGLVREEDGLVRLAPHLGWVEEDLTVRLASETGLPTLAANDASLGAVAELTFGAGRGATDLVYLNGGASGIGGGIVVDGSVYGGAGGYAGEWGHTRVAAPSSMDESSIVLEDHVSRARLVRVLGLDNPSPLDLDEAVTASTAADVAEEIERQVSVLAVAAGNIVNVLNPEIVVLGGFLGTLVRCTGDRFAELVAEGALGATLEGTRFVPAELGADLLMIAGAELVFADILRDPTASRTPPSPSRTPPTPTLSPSRTPPSPSRTPSAPK
jgi:predicted NBD/HSP70 family sugar kinase